MDPAYKKRLLADAPSAIAELGYTSGQGEHTLESARSDDGAGCSMSTQSESRRMSSSRGPQDPAHNFEKMLTTWETTRPRCSLRGQSSPFSPRTCAPFFGSKKNHVVFSRSRDVMGEDVFDELAVGVDHGDAGARGNIPRDHVAQEGALAGTGRTEDGQVVAPGLRRNGEDGLFVLIPILISGADGESFEHKLNCEGA